MSPHWLRHAHASHALERGAPVALVRDTLGHRSVSTTNGYRPVVKGVKPSRRITKARRRDGMLRALALLPQKGP